MVELHELEGEEDYVIQRQCKGLWVAWGWGYATLDEAIAYKNHLDSNYPNTPHRVVKYSVRMEVVC